MRLACPNCGADYDVPEGMVPAAGRHVQCSACHTRWFVRGTAETAGSEEQILARLENWRPRPTGLPPSPERATRARSAERLRVVPSPEPTGSDPALSDLTPPEPARPEPSVAAPRPAPPTIAEAIAAPPRPLPTTKPAARPTVARPASVPDAPLRPAPRLDLDGPAPLPAPAPPPQRSRFLHGFVLVLLLAGGAFGAYRTADRIVQAAPDVAPALDTYTRTIDDWRIRLDRLVAPYRNG